MLAVRTMWQVFVQANIEFYVYPQDLYLFEGMLIRNPRVNYILCFLKSLIFSTHQVKFDSY